MQCNRTVVRTVVIMLIQYDGESLDETLGHCICRLLDEAPEWTRRRVDRVRAVDKLVE